MSILPSWIFVHFSILKDLHNLLLFIALIVFLPLSLLFTINVVLLKYSYITFLLHLPRYLYPFFSTSLILSSPVISAPLNYTIFPYFITSNPHLFIPNPTLISLLNICVVETNPFTYRSFFAKIFKSSINKRWFNFCPYFKVYPDYPFLNIWVRGIIQITNSNGDKLFPLILMFARYSLHDVKFVLQFFIDLQNATNVIMQVN